MAKSVNKNSTPDNRLISAILFVFAFILYANSIPNNYNLDDELVTRNHHLTSQGIKAIPEIFVSPYYQDGQGYAYDYRPIVLVSFAIEHSLFGESASVSHFINVLLYAFLGIIIFHTLLNLFAGYNYLLPFVSALLFIAHPLHTEAVASIKNRDEILCLLFGILSLFYMLRYMRTKFLLSLLYGIIFFLLAILSKKSITAFAFIIPVAGIIFVQGVRFRDVLYITMPLALIAAFFAPIYLMTEKLLLFAAIFFLPIFFYMLFIKHILIKNSLSSIKQLFVKIVISIKEYVKNFDTSVNNKINYSLENAAGSSDDFEIRNSYINICLISLGIAVAISAYLFNSSYLAAGALIFSGFSFILPTGGLKNAAFLIFNFILAVLIYLYSAEQLLIITIILVFAAILLNNQLSFTALILSLFPHVILIFIFYPAMLHTIYIGIPLIIFTFLSFRTKWLWMLGFAIPVILIVQDIITFYAEKEPFNFYELIISISTILILLFWKIIQTRPLLIKALMVGAISISSIYLIGKSPVHAFTFQSEINLSIPEPAINQSVLLAPVIENPQNDNNDVMDFLTGGRKLQLPENPIPYEQNFLNRASTSTYVLGRYLLLHIFPHPLRYYYGYKEIEVMTFIKWAPILSLLLHLAMFTTSLLLLRKQPIISLGIFIYLFSILAYSNFTAPVAGVMGDRLAFVASLGFVLVLGNLLFLLFKIDLLRQNVKFMLLPRPFLIVLFFILVLYSGKTLARNAQWENHLILFSHDIKYLEESVQAHNLLATHFVINSLNESNSVERRRLLLEAAAHFEKAIELYPDIHNFWYDLGRVNVYLQNYHDALIAFKKSFEINPQFADAGIKAATILDERGKLNEAIVLYEQAIQYDPENIVAYTNLSFIYFRQGKHEQSINVNKQAIQHNPQAYEPYVNIGKTYMAMGMHQQALEYLEAGAKLNSSDIDLLNMLANIFNQVGNTQKAQYYYNLARGAR